MDSWTLLDTAAISSNLSSGVCSTRWWLWRHSQHLKILIFPSLASWLKTEFAKSSVQQKSTSRENPDPKHPYQTTGLIKVLMRAFLTAKRHHLLMIQVYYLHPPTILKWEGISFLPKPLDLTHIHHSSLPNVIFSFLFMLHTTCIPSESSCTGCRRLSWVSKATSRQENVYLAYFTFQLVILDSSICGRSEVLAEGLQFTGNKLCPSVCWKFRWTGLQARLLRPFFEWQGQCGLSHSHKTQSQSYLWGNKRAQNEWDPCITSSSKISFNKGHPSNTHESWFSTSPTWS